MAKVSSPFDNLPDELVLKIIKSAFKIREPLRLGRQRVPSHDFLLNTVAKISTRFMRIAKDKSLWSGKVVISGDDQQNVKRVIHEFIDSSATQLEVHLKAYERETNAVTIGVDDIAPLISEEDMCAVAKKCPNMEHVTEKRHSYAPKSCQSIQTCTVTRPLRRV